MFKEVIGKTMATDALSNDYFRNIISGTAYSEDQSFLSTARCLLLKRMPEALSIIRYEYNDPNRFFNEVSLDWCGNSIVVVNCNSDEDITISDTRKKTLSDYGYEKVEKITAFYQKTFPVVCYLTFD